MHLSPTKFHKPKTPNINIATVAIKLVASRTDARLSGLIVDKILRCKMLPGFLFLGLVPIGCFKPRITLSKQDVGHVAVNLLVKQQLHVLFGVKSRVGAKLGLFENVPLDPDSFKILAGPFDHRLQQLVLLGLSKSLSMHHHLMLAIDRGYPIITLNHPMRALHLGALIVRQIALSGLATLAYFLLVLFKPALKLFDPGSQGIDLLLLALY